MGWGASYVTKIARFLPPFEDVVCAEVKDPAFGYTIGVIAPLVEGYADLQNAFFEFIPLGTFPWPGGCESDHPPGGGF